MDLKLDIEGDLAFEGGDFVLIDGHEAVGQDLSTCLKSCRGDWILDENVGIPFYEFIFVKNPNRLIVNAIITEAIESRPGVDSVIKIIYDFDGATRTLSLAELRVRMDDGEILEYKDLVLDI